MAWSPAKRSLPRLGARPGTAPDAVDAKRARSAAGAGEELDLDLDGDRGPTPQGQIGLAARAIRRA